MNKAIVDGRPCPHPRCATHDVYLPVFIVEQNLVGIDAVQFRLLRSRSLGIYTRVTRRNVETYTHTRCTMETWRHPQNRKYISKCRQRRTKPPPQATCPKLVRFRCVVSEIREQTDVLITIVYTTPGDSSAK